MRFAERSGSIAAEKAIMENWGTSRNAIRMGMPDFIQIGLARCQMSRYIIATSCSRTIVSRDEQTILKLPHGRTILTTMDESHNGELEHGTAPATARGPRQASRGKPSPAAAAPQVLNPYPPMEVLVGGSARGHSPTSLRILEELGMEVMSPRALAAAAERRAPKSMRRPTRSAWIVVWSRAR